MGTDANKVDVLGLVERPDQWTLLLGRELPLVKLAVHDGAGTEVYVSPDSAEVELVTTRRTRALAWVATIPHWFYVTPLRIHQPEWYWTVVIVSGLGCVLAFLGLVVGVLQLNGSKPFRWSTAIRSRGWLRWHHVLGLVFGVFALTWVFSGLLSMEPFAWTNARGLDVGADALSGAEEMDRIYIGQ